MRERRKFVGCLCVLTVVRTSVHVMIVHRMYRRIMRAGNVSAALIVSVVLHCVWMVCYLNRVYPACPLMYHACNWRLTGLSVMIMMIVMMGMVCIVRYVIVG